MAADASLKDQIQQIIHVLMGKVLNRVLHDDPFVPENHHAAKPLYAALVPDEVFRSAHFERRFVTPFGSIWEQLALVVARRRMKHVETGKRIDGLVGDEQLRRITGTLNRLEHRPEGRMRTPPNWVDEIAWIRQGEGSPLPISVICDVYCEDEQGVRRAFELKSPLPNSDISKVSKEKLFKLHSMQPTMIDEAYFALPYNPYQHREAYAWTHPKRWFDMQRDPVVLIGEEFWDMIGGAGTYGILISAVNEIAWQYKERIYREFLGVDPPHDAFHPL
jgi:hypothetical protein